MEVKEISNPPAGGKKIWEDFLLNCGEKTFLQSWNWGEFNETMGRKSWRLGIYDNDKIVAVVLISKIGAKRSTFLFISHGPVTIDGLSTKDKKEVLRLLLIRLLEIAKDEKAVFIRISPIWLRNEESVKLFKDLKFREAPIHMHPETTWELDITKPEEDLLMDMRKTTRYLIRQAEKNSDIKIIKSNNLEDLEFFNYVYSETGKRQHFVIYQKKYTENEFTAFLKDKQVSLFLGKYKDEVVSAAIFIFWQNACFYHHSGSLLKYNKIPVSYLLQWEAIKEAKKRGCLVYNFWGITPDIKKSKHPWDGLSLFKMGFGGYKKNYVVAQDFIISPKYWLSYIIEILRKIKRGL